MCCFPLCRNSMFSAAGKDSFWELMLEAKKCNQTVFPVLPCFLGVGVCSRLCHLAVELQYTVEHCGTLVSLSSAKGLGWLQEESLRTKPSVLSFKEQSLENYLFDWPDLPRGACLRWLCKHGSDKRRRLPDHLASS